MPVKLTHGCHTPPKLLGLDAGSAGLFLGFCMVSLHLFNLVSPVVTIAQYQSQMSLT